jgi:hypothetical protein
LSLRRFVVDCAISGTAGAVLSWIAAGARSRVEHGAGRGHLPMHAVSHIAWGDSPASHTGRKPHNLVVGTALHYGASVFWAFFFESLFGKNAERSTAAALIGGTTISACAYVTDYHVVSDRFKPGYEAYLSDRSLLLVYTALAVGLAAGARLRGLYHHQVKNDHERDERRHAERRPDRVVAPE